MAAHTIKVTPVQVAAAKLRLSIDQQLGRQSSAAVVRIANARSRWPQPTAGPAAAVYGSAPPHPAD